MPKETRVHVRISGRDRKAIEHTAGKGRLSAFARAAIREKLAFLEQGQQSITQEEQHGQAERRDQ